MIKIMARGQSEAEILVHEAIGENWYGDGLTSKRFRQELKDLGPVSKIKVDINSDGGAVSDGISIYNALRTHGARVEVTISGRAASIASIIAMAGDKITMLTGAQVMIHSPWTIALGNAQEMREVADVLDQHEDALLDIYTKRSGADRAQIKEMLANETWLSGKEAADLGFCDECDDTEATEDTEAKAAHREAFKRFADEFRRNTAALTPLQIAAALKSAVADATQETTVKTPAASVPGAQPPNTPTPPAAAPAAQPPAASPSAAAPAAVTQADVDAARAAGIQAEVSRRNEITSRFSGPLASEHAALLQTCLADQNCTPDAASKVLLDAIGKKAAPLTPTPTAIIVPGADESDKLVAASTVAIMARIGLTVKDKDGKRDVLPTVDASNPYRGFSLFDMAEHCVRARGIVTNRMNRSEIVSIAFRGRVQAAAYGHTTSDFPKLLENVMHKLLLVAYMGANTTWERICRIGDLTDFRAHPRYRFGTFSDIKTVNEAGRYEQGTISDAEKETITAVRKGRILVITREMIVNDDLQALSDSARGLGRAANRTIDKDVYALFASNGPTMGDGNALFHASHNNIAAVAAAPTVTSVDAARVLMAKQTDPSGNDFIDIRPAVSLSPLVLGSQFRVLNESQYDPDAANKLQRPNVVRGLLRDTVDSPRLDALSAQIWYVLADPNEEPVFEVGFIGGNRQPRVEQEQEFSSDSLQWKVVHEYGVAAIGWRGIVKNAGV